MTKRNLIRLQRKLPDSGETIYVDPKDDTKLLIKYCNVLTDKINELIDEIDRLNYEIGRIKTSRPEDYYCPYSR